LLAQRFELSGGSTIALGEDLTARCAGPRSRPPIACYWEAAKPSRDETDNARAIAVTVP
jgi:hypothetical protein